MRTLEQIFGELGHEDTSAYMLNSGVVEYGGRMAMEYDNRKLACMDNE